MKKGLLFPLLLSTFLFVISCNNGQVKKSETETRTLIGKWDPVNVERNDLTENDKKEILDGGYMDFDKDGQFTIQSREGGQSRTGLFKYDEKTNALKLISGNEEKNYAIEWVANNKLILVVPEENLRISFNKRNGLMPTDEKKDNDDGNIGDDRPVSIVGVWKPVDVVAEDMSEDEKNRILNEQTIEFTSSGNYIAARADKNEYGKYT